MRSCACGASAGNAIAEADQGSSGDSDRVFRRARIAILLLALAGAVSCGSLARNATPPGSSRIVWIDQPVTFTTDGMTIYATFRHPRALTNKVPAAVLIAGSGPTDRNGNSPLISGSVDTLKTVADWLSADGVATLRYDKLGT